MSFRDEFRWKKLGFSQNVPLQRFFVFHWRLPGLAYLIYRILAACYCLTWLIYTASRDNSNLAWGAFLTNWTYTLETSYFVVHAVFAVFFYLYSFHRNSVGWLVRLCREDHASLFPEVSEVQDEHRIYQQIPSDSEEDSEQNLLDPAIEIESPQQLPWYVVLLWILFNCVSSAAVMVTIVFWAVLVPTNSSNSDLGKLNLDNLQLHLFNSVLLVIEQSVTAVPIHVLHVVYPIAYGLIYLAFSIFYWVPDHHHVMYNILDWNKPAPTVGYVLAVGFVVIPIIHMLIYAIYRIKLLIFKLLCV